MIILLSSSPDVYLTGAAIINELVSHHRFFVYDVDTQYHNLGVKVGIHENLYAEHILCAK